MWIRDKCLKVFETVITTDVYNMYYYIYGNYRMFNNLKCVYGMHKRMRMHIHTLSLWESVASSNV